MREEPTTPDPEATFRRSIAAIGRRDFDGALAGYGPDAVWDGATTGVGVFRGREAVRGFFEDWVGAYDDYEQVIEGFRDLGEDVTLVVTLQRAWLPGRGGVVQGRYARVLIWNDGLIQRVTIYLAVDEAREAAERLVEERG